MKRKRSTPKRQENPAPPPTPPGPPPPPPAKQIDPSRGTHIGFFDINGDPYEVRSAPHSLGRAGDRGELEALIDYGTSTVWLARTLSVRSAKMVLAVIARVAAGPGGSDVLPEQLTSEERTDDLREGFADAVRKIMGMPKGGE